MSTAWPRRSKGTGLQPVTVATRPAPRLHQREDPRGRLAAGVFILLRWILFWRCNSMPLSSSRMPSSLMRQRVMMTGRQQR